MCGLEAWIGDCYLRDVEDGTDYRCHAAVWASDHDNFCAALAAHIEPLGLAIIWLEEALPTSHYLAQNGTLAPLQTKALAEVVHSRHLVELGPMQRVATDGVPQRYLTIEDHRPVPLHDQTGIPVWDQDWIAPELKELLFGQPEDEPKMRTYLIVDANLRKNITGVFDLDSVDVPVQCLFKGETAQELEESAPYLIDMTLPDGAWEDRALVPDFHRDFFRNHWGHNTGIFIRTNALMGEVWRHFRKFTLVPREGRKTRVFVRFWDEQYIRLYFPHIADNRERVALWFLRDGFCVRGLLADQDGGKAVREILLQHALFLVDNIPSKPFEITNYDLAPFYKEREQKDLRKLAAALKKGFPNDLRHYSEEMITSLIDEPVARMVAYGFSQQKHLYILAAWSLFFGKTFDQKDPSGYLLDIFKSSLSEADKMSALKNRMDQLSPATGTTS